MPRSLFATILLLFSCFSFAQNSVTLTSWNIEWLSIEAGKVTRQPQDFVKLAQYADKTQADVIAFQEVASKTAIQQVVGNQYAIYLSDRALPANRHLQFKDNNQYTGFAVRQGIKVLDVPDFALTRGGSKLRFASYIVLNPNQADELHLLSIHLKAGCSGAYRNNRECNTVKKQGIEVANWIKTRQANDQHYAVLGDFNHNLAYRGDWLWKAISKGTNAQLVTKNTKAECKVRSNRDPNKTHQFRSVIDHIVINGNLKASQGKQTVFVTQDALNYKLSDHCPVSSTVSF